MSVVQVPLEAQLTTFNLWLRGTYPVKVHLYSSDLTPDQLLSLATCLADEATYAGYVVQVVSPPPPFDDSIALYSGCGPTAVGFPGPTDGSNPSIYGWFATIEVEGDDDTHLVAAARFDSAPIVLDGPDGGLIFGFTLRLKQIGGVPYRYAISINASFPINGGDTIQVVANAVDAFGNIVVGYDAVAGVALLVNPATPATVSTALVWIEDAGGGGGVISPSYPVTAGSATFTVKYMTNGGNNFDEIEIFLMLLDGTIEGASDTIPVKYPSP